MTKEERLEALVLEQSLGDYLSRYEGMTPQEAMDALVKLTEDEPDSCWSFDDIGISVWEPFENHCAGALLEVIENHMDSLRSFAQEVLAL